MDNYMNIVIKAMKQWVTDKFSSWDLAIDNKVDKIKGKGLSTEDYTTEEKEKLASINLKAMLPEVTEENNGEVLSVVNGKWDTKNIPQADQNQNDAAAADYIKNRTHWIDNTQRTLIALAENYEFYDGYSNPDIDITSYGRGLIIGEAYYVMWDGIEYPNLIAFDDDGYPTLGDFYHNVGNEYPFNIYTYEEDGIIYLSAIDNGINEESYHSFSVYENNLIYHQLDEKFIPDSIARVDEIPSPLPEVTEENNGEVLAVVEGEWSTKYISEPKQADWNQVDSTAIDYIKNKPILTKSYLVLKDKNTNLDYQLAIEDGVLISELMRYFIDITVKTLPSKNAYMIGERFDPTGMVLLATDINNASIEITDGYIYPENQLKHTDEIIISYVHNGITYTINLNTTININGIEIFTLPDITNYTEGQVFNPTGMIVGVKGENDYFEIITDYSYDTNPLTVDMNSIDISYNYNDIVYTASVPITVVALDIALQDFTYTNKNNGDVELNTWKETYNGENSTDIIIPNYSSIII